MIEKGGFRVALFLLKGAEMKIRITTTRNPWVNGSSQDMGAVIDVDDDAGEILLAHGFAEKVPGRAKKVDDDE